MYEIVHHIAQGFPTSFLTPRHLRGKYCATFSASH